MAGYKVEICGVNTSDLPLLKPTQAKRTKKKKKKCRKIFKKKKFIIHRGKKKREKTKAKYIKGKTLVIKESTTLQPEW